MRFDKAFGNLSNFGKMYRESRKPKHEYSGTFSYRPSLSTGVPFRKAENVPKIFAKLVNENVQNHCPKLVVIFVIFGHFQKIPVITP